MKIKIGNLGYLLLIISAAFIDAPIISIFVMPLFLIGAVLLIVFHIKLIPKEQENSWFNVMLAVLGSLIICGILGYAAVEYNQYQVEVDRVNFAGSSHIDWLKILFIAGATILGTSLIFLGIRTNNKISQSSIFLILLPAILLVPLTLLFIKISILTGIWFGG